MPSRSGTAYLFDTNVVFLQYCNTEHDAFIADLYIGPAHHEPHFTLLLAAETARELEHWF